MVNNLEQTLIEVGSKTDHDDTLNDKGTAAAARLDIADDNLSERVRSQKLAIINEAPSPKSSYYRIIDKSVKHARSRSNVSYESSDEIQTSKMISVASSLELYR